MPFSKKLLSLFLSAILCLVGYAQQFNFKNYTVKEGLANSSVNTIFQDSKGYIWFGTQGGGVSRFNGKEFTTLTKKDGLINNDVTYITEDRKGNIWIGTAEGASKFDGLIFTNYGAKNGLADNIVYSIYADDHKVWLAVLGAGIKIFDGHKFDSITIANGLSSNDVFTITSDKKGNYWFGLSNGISRYDGKRLTNYSNTDKVKDKTYFSSLADNKGNIWFGSTSGTVLVIDRNLNIESVQLPSAVQHDFIGGITQDNGNNLWFATEHGLLRYSENGFKLFTEKEGLALNSILSVSSDYEGNVWIGTLGGGVSLFTGQTFIYYTVKDGLKSANITAICNSKDFYVGTAGNGINLFNPKSSSTFKSITGVKELENANISSLATDKRGLIWVAADDGVYVLQKTNNKFLLKEKINAINGQDIISAHKIIIDSKDNCWVATYGSGIFLITPNNRVNYSLKSNFPSDKILTLFEDSKSNIWVGTQDAGVVRYDGHSFDIISTKQGLPEQSVWSIAEGENGDIYFGTAENGLCCFDGKKMTVITTKEGICSNFISSLTWDAQENCLWLGAENGINKVQFNFNHSIKSINTYSKQQSYNLFGVNHDAIFVDSAGLVWFGNPNGLLCYNSLYDIPKKTPPKILLTGIRLAYQKVDWRKYTDSIESNSGLPFNLQLSYSNNHLVFDIQAFTNDDVWYKYKLEGQDEDWSPLTKNSEINYSNITPGKKYTFRSKAVNSNGIWSEESKPFSFTIKPPWWDTLWFKGTLFTLLLTCLIIFIKVRESVLKKQNQKLESTVASRTAELLHEKERVEEKNVLINKEKDRSEALLLNILPAEVAEELKEKGSANAKLFDDVTVLFTDFKSFTTVSERLTPQQLVDELHACFSAFDAIMEKYNIEKIKTVGDAYLAVAGLPLANLNHSKDVIHAAIEISEFIKQRRAEKGDDTFDIRIGVHSGSVVAGIVGVKKFAYDIWGDTVNTAARMEQNSEPGKINISQTTYELVKDKFNCKYRGEIEAKNKGKLKMYFVEGSLV